MKDLKDWDAQLQGKLDKLGKDDLQSLFFTCETYSAEIRTATNWLNKQLTFIESVKRQANDWYYLRFHENIPQPHPQIGNYPQIQPEKAIEAKGETSQSINKLTNKKERGKVTTEIALQISEIGKEITTQAIYTEMQKRSIDLGVGRPGAVIGTFLGKLRSNFEKIQGRKGVFKRIA